MNEPGLAWARGWDDEMTGNAVLISVEAWSDPDRTKWNEGLTTRARKIMRRLLSPDELGLAVLEAARSGEFR